MTKDQLNTNEYIAYYQVYIDNAGELDLIEGLKQNGEATISFLESLSEDKYDFAYADGKWTIKELVQHIMDTERVFTFRALSFARKDKTNFPGYDQDEYAVTSEANKRSKQSLLEEYKALRQSTVALFENFTDEMLLQIGYASNNDISVRAIGFILIGHENHHCQIIKERYL
ncbi:DinB family protein [Psychroserpens jangbogonensis]|uniref:DinB family protein n=1 Tax=Psychroserpens jangbogonensis TaxID=1484460 RepID=UPI00053D4652|nr:DinB family protein [Psychroserpens jangbogonensis]